MITYNVSTRKNISISDFLLVHRIKKAANYNANKSFLLHSHRLLPREFWLNGIFQFCISAKIFIDIKEWRNCLFKSSRFMLNMLFSLCLVLKLFSFFSFFFDFVDHMIYQWSDIWSILLNTKSHILKKILGQIKQCWSK